MVLANQNSANVKRITEKCVGCRLSRWGGANVDLDESDDLQ